MREVFKKNDIKQICYKQWISQPKKNLQKASVLTTTFIQNFTIFGKTFLTYSIIASQQAACYKNTKKNLQSNQCLLVCDFTENYAFIIQNAVLGFNWNNNQATIFPIVFYYNDNGSISRKTLVLISDCKKHDSVAVYIFIKAFNEFLSSYHQSISDCIYLSDGAPQQFKNVKHFSTIYWIYNLIRAVFFKI